jgi:hypothetical protein
VLVVGWWGVVVMVVLAVVATSADGEGTGGAPPAGRTDDAAAASMDHASPAPGGLILLGPMSLPAVPRFAACAEADETKAKTKTKTKTKTKERGIVGYPKMLGTCVSRTDRRRRLACRNLRRPGDGSSPCSAPPPPAPPAPLSSPTAAGTSASSPPTSGESPPSCWPGAPPFVPSPSFSLGPSGPVDEGAGMGTDWISFLGEGCGLWKWLVESGDGRGDDVADLDDDGGSTVRSSPLWASRLAVVARSPLVAGSFRDLESDSFLLSSEASGGSPPVLLLRPMMLLPAVVSAAAAKVSSTTTLMPLPLPSPAFRCSSLADESVLRLRLILLLFFFLRFLPSFLLLTIEPRDDASAGPPCDRPSASESSFPLRHLSAWLSSTSAKLALLSRSRKDCGPSHHYH